MKFENVLESEEVILYNDVNEFLEDYKNKDEIVFVIGGGTIYRLFIDKVDEIYLTEIDAECNDATVYFPNFNKNEFNKEELSSHSENDLNYKHVLYRRK